MPFFDNIIKRLRPGKTESPPSKLPHPSVDFERPVPKQDQLHACDSYTTLKTRFRDVGRMNAIIEILGRDFLTAMPEGAYKSRLGQISYLYRRMHEDLTSDEVHGLLQDAREHQYAEPGKWDDWDSANLQQMEELYRMYCHVDAELMEKKARLSYEGRRRHREILKTGDWPQAKGFLKEQIELHRRIADSRCRATEEQSHYQMLMQEFMPGAKVSEVESMFAEHEAVLKDLLPQILDKQASESTPVSLDSTEEKYGAEAQMWLNRSLLEVIGFDFERGGLYETGHNPVEGGTVDDTRLVISNVDTHNFMYSLKSALHEGGHGLYIQGLPRATWRYQPVAMDMGAAVHESQALLVEMIIGRMEEFFEFLSPRLEGLFHSINSPMLSPENLFALKTRVKQSVDRKKADEVTYFYHILLRFRLERDLIEGKMEVDELPEAWVEGMHKLLGVTPNNHVEGCLQDVHWFVGKFGYFPAYALGHMIAAQLFRTMRKDLNGIGSLISTGEFGPIQKWLQENVHSKGRLYSRNELLERATGMPLTPAYLEKHLRKRYLG